MIDMTNGREIGEEEGFNSNLALIAMVI